MIPRIPPINYIALNHLLAIGYLVTEYPVGKNLFFLDYALDTLGLRMPSYLRERMLHSVPNALQLSQYSTFFWNVLI